MAELPGEVAIAWTLKPSGSDGSDCRFPQSQAGGRNHWRRRLPHERRRNRARLRNIAERVLPSRVIARFHPGMSPNAIDARLRRS